jgi:hypothetical protein
MSAPLITCYLHSRNGEQVLCTYYLSSTTAITKQMIAAFPYEGNFHFRLKVSGRKIGFDDCDYFWMDLKNVSDVSSFVEDPNNLEVQVLYLDANLDETCMLEIPETEYNKYLNQIKKDAWFQNRSSAMKDNSAPSVPHPSNTKTTTGTAHNARPSKYQEEDSEEEYLDEESNPQKNSASPHSNQPDNNNTTSSAASSSALPINVQSVKKGATNLWNAMKATASTIQQSVTAGSSSNSASISSSAEHHLCALTRHISRDFSYENPTHLELLSELWASQIVPLTSDPAEKEGLPAHSRDADGAIVSNGWKLAGWQNSNMVKDLKITGLLAIHCNLYFAHHYSDLYQQYLQENKNNIKTNYPFAIVSINLTLLLIELFSLRDYK